MVERLPPEIHKVAIRVSKSFEKVWQIRTNPSFYSSSDKKWAEHFLEMHALVSINSATPEEEKEIPPEIYEQVVMGIYHRNLEPPFEFKYHPKLN